MRARCDDAETRPAVRVVVREHGIEIDVERALREHGYLT
jgi:hypothetical protein